MEGYSHYRREKDLGTLKRTNTDRFSFSEKSIRDITSLPGCWPSSGITLVSQLKES